MKEKISHLITLFLMMTGLSVIGQVAYSPAVENLSNQITEESLLELINPLTGATPTTISGEEYTIATRHAFTEGNERAAQWIYERLEEFGLEPWYHEYDENGTNVLAQITGSEYPEKQYIICGHYDAMPTGSLAPGADDNASGTVAVLEAARILANQSPNYTIIFALWDEEEIGLYGSEHYAQQAVFNGDNILGVINLDMIAWDSEGDYKCSVSKNALSYDLTMSFIDIMNLYQPELESEFITSQGSDHASFWEAGYPALLLIEDFDDFNANYHTPSDEVSSLNFDYYEKMSRVALAALSTFAFDCYIDMDHNPILSDTATGGRVAKLAVGNLEEIDDGENAPRLYYKTNDDESYEFINAYNTDEDTLFYLIPGQPLGTTIEYYFALQEGDGNLIATLPTGGLGINPPGTESPDTTFSYMVDYIYRETFCSANAPFDIPGYNTIKDTVFIEGESVVLDVNLMVNITHNNVGNLSMKLTGPNDETVTLSHANGDGGEGYDETIFDDEAQRSIREGLAPFSGTYQPEEPLSVFDEIYMEGEWVLTITDFISSDEGVLNDWCLILEYGPDQDVGIETEMLSHDNLRIYPNPASRTLNIKSHIIENTNATIAIYDMFGRVVKQVARRSFTRGDYTFQTNIKDLAVGHYVVKMSSDLGTITKKLIISR